MSGSKQSPLSRRATPGAYQIGGEGLNSTVPPGASTVLVVSRIEFTRGEKKEGCIHSSLRTHASALVEAGDPAHVRREKDGGRRKTCIGSHRADAERRPIRADWQAGASGLPRSRR